MKQLIVQGGPMMWLLVVCGIVALGVFLERLMFFRKVSMNTREWIVGVLGTIGRGNYEEALRECATAHGPVARVAAAVVERHALSWQELDDVAAKSAQIEIPRLQRHLPLLGAIAVTAPLLGLLGAILGLLPTFQMIHAQGGNATIVDVSGNVYASLVAVAASLVVAIPAFAAHSYLVARVNDFIADMERSAIRISMAIRDQKAGVGA